jgi:CheY-like chemotaxis protein
MAEATSEKSDKKSILIVDDDSFLLDMYSLRFTQGGYKVETAMDSEEALSKLKSGINPDVILLDVVMPSTDGFELLEKINQENLVPKVPKIFLSNLGQEQDIVRGKALGAIGYIIKANSTPSEVVAKVEELINTK